MLPTYPSLPSDYIDKIIKINTPSYKLAKNLIYRWLIKMKIAVLVKAQHVSVISALQNSTN